MSNYSYPEGTDPILQPAGNGMPTRFDFQGRKVVLTGAARGIGLELTRLLVPRGARIIAVGRDKASLQALRDQFPGKVETRAADLSQD